MDAGGAIYVGELASGRIVQVGGMRPPSEGLIRLPVTVPLVEGMARIGDTFYAASQADDRIVTFKVADSSYSSFLQLRPVPGLEGVDGIAATADSLLVPDSSRGTLLFVGTDGNVRRTVSGFARPTGAWPLPDGSVLVADENAGSIVKVTPEGGKQVLLAGLPLADDVVADQQGRIFAISITRNSLVEVANGAAQEVAAGLRQPQGIAVGAAGNLLVTEFDAGRLDLVLTSFRLWPVAAVVQLRPGQGLCVRLQRAPGFADPVTIRAAAGYSVISQPAAGSSGEVEPAACPLPPCLLSIQVEAGSRTDVVVAAYGPPPRERITGFQGRV